MYFMFVYFLICVARRS